MTVPTFVIMLTLAPCFSFITDARYSASAAQSACEIKTVPDWGSLAKDEYFSASARIELLLPLTFATFMR